MKTIMIDMDDVLLENKFGNYICEFLGKNVDFEHECNRFRQEIIEGKEQEFRDKYSMRNIYENVKLFDNCYEVIKKLNDIYDVYICTDFVWNYNVIDAKQNLINKYNYLTTYLDFISPSKYIFGKTKKIINFDIKIDDSINNLEGASCKLLYTAWQNKKYDYNYLEAKNIIRVSNWKEIEKILLNDDNIYNKQKF